MYAIRRNTFIIHRNNYTNRRMSLHRSHPTNPTKRPTFLCDTNNTNHINCNNNNNNNNYCHILNLSQARLLSTSSVNEFPSLLLNSTCNSSRRNTRNNNSTLIDTYKASNNNNNKNDFDSQQILSNLAKTTTEDQYFGHSNNRSCRAGCDSITWSSTPGISVLCRTNVYNFYDSKSIKNHDFTSVRYLHLSQSYEDSKEPSKPSSSKVEDAVKAIKEDKEEKERALVQPPKRSLWKKIEDEILHYYHGFRLLFIDVRIAFGLIKQILNGKSLSRREHRQLIRTTSDVFRLVPFSVFIIVPFMEFLLPVFLKLFPGMLPSTFQTKNEKEKKMKQELKVKLEMAKFLQETLDDMAVSGKGRSSEKAKEFAEFFSKIRTSGGEISNNDIIKFSKLFEDEITLDSLSRQQLTALCHLLEISTIGNTALLRFQLRMRLRSLAADDRTIESEGGVNSLNVTELQQACKARGMRALGVPEERLRRQLESWLQLSLHEKVPPSLLLLSRALYVPENLPASAQLQATLSALPEAAAVQAKAAIGEREGKVDNKTRIEVLKEEERKILEERQEQLVDEEAKKAAAKEELVEEIVDKYLETSTEKKVEKAKGHREPPPLATELLPTVNALLGPEILRHDTAKTVQETIERRLTKHVPHPLADLQKDPLTAEDIEKIENALDVLGSQKRELYIETEELEDLKEEMAEYQEDLKDLDVISKETKVHESKAAKRLAKRVNTMIGKLDNVVQTLQKEGSELTEEIKTSSDIPEAKKSRHVMIQDMVDALKSIQDVSDPARMERIVDVLESLDDNKDGQIEVEDLLKVIEVIGRENVKLNPTQIEDIVKILEKEELLTKPKVK